MILACTLPLFIGGMERRYPRAYDTHLERNETWSGRIMCGEHGTKDAR